MLRRDRRYDIGCSDPCSSRSGTGLPLRGAIGRFLMNARGRVLARVLFAAATIVVPRVAIVLDLPEARAVPSFARQTGMPCDACHSGGFYPELNNFGRMFKMNGYIWSAHGEKP